MFFQFFFSLKFCYYEYTVNWTRTLIFLDDEKTLKIRNRNVLFRDRMYLLFKILSIMDIDSAIRMKTKNTNRD